MAVIVIASLKIKDGQRPRFDEFERQALAIMQQHGGELLRALKPVALLPPGELPDEVHVLCFPSQEALDLYREDPNLKALAPLRAEAIAATHLLVGHTLA